MDGAMTARLTIGFLVTSLLLAGMLPLEGVLAHPGGLDAAGCHTNRKTGDYHCHRKSGASVPARPAAPSAPARASSGGVYYRSCAEARAAGVAPLLRGDPGYRAGLDRDNDGRACE